MFCLRCGTEFADSLEPRFCMKCGMPLAAPVYAQPIPINVKGNGFAITSFVLGLLGLGLWIFAPIGIVSCLVGGVMGILGTKSCKYQGLAIAGIILCGIFLIASFLALAPFMEGFTQGMNGSYSNY